MKSSKVFFLFVLLHAVPIYFDKDGFKKCSPFFSLSSDEEKEPDVREEKQEEEDEEEEMERKLAELKATEVAELKRYHNFPFCVCSYIVSFMLIYVNLYWEAECPFIYFPLQPVSLLDFVVLFKNTEFQLEASSIRKKKKLLKERRKQRERVALKMDLPGVSIADGGDSSMFSLSTINKQKVNPEGPRPRGHRCWSPLTSPVLFFFILSGGGWYLQGRHAGSRQSCRWRRWPAHLRGRGRWGR